MAATYGSAASPQPSSLKDCLPHCLVTEDSFRPAKFKVLPWSWYTSELNSGDTLNCPPPSSSSSFLLWRGATRCHRGVTRRHRCGASRQPVLSAPHLGASFLSFWPFSLGLSTLSPSSTTVLAWPSVELLRPSNSGNRASARACCASWRLWSPLRTLSSCFSFDLFPLLFFLGAVLPKKLIRGSNRRIKCSRGYPQSTSPRRSGDQPRAPLPCDGGTPTSKHKKANQLTQTFSQCLRCTWVHKREGLQMQPLQQLYTCNHGLMYRVIFLTLKLLDLDISLRANGWTSHQQSRTHTSRRFEIRNQRLGNHLNKTSRSWEMEMVNLSRNHQMSPGLTVSRVKITYHCTWGNK